MGEGEGCRKPEEHHLHLCMLKQSLGKKELAALTGRPNYVCALCGGRTLHGKNLCQPKKLRR